MPEATNDQDSSVLSHEQLLKALHEVTIELTHTDSLDDLCRRAVELAQERLGFRRIGIWFLSDDRKHLHGSFGVDRDGNICDERGISQPIVETAKVRAILEDKTRRIHIADKKFYERDCEVAGTGDADLAGMWDGQRMIGIVNTNTLLEGKPKSEAQLEILSLFALTLGHLCSLRRANDVARRSEKHLRDILEVSKDVTYKLDLATGTYEYLSPSVETLLGYTVEDFIGMGFETASERFHPEDRTRNKEHFENLLAHRVEEKIEPTIEYRWCRKDGVYRWYSDSRFVTFDDSGKPVAIVGTVRDITEQKESTDAILESERRFRALSEQLPDLVWQKDRDGVYVSVNNQYAATLGKTSAEIVGRIDEDLYPPEIAARYRADDERVMRTGQIYEEEEPGQSLESGGWFLTRKSPVIDEEGQCVGTIGISRDITHRKEAEATLRRQSQALEQTLDGVAVADMDGVIEYVNLAWARMHGYRPEELVGQHLRIFHTPEQMTQDVRPFNECVKMYGGHSGHVGHVTRDGHVFQTSMSSSILRDPDGTPIGFVARASDISRELELEAQLRHSQKMEAVGVLAGGIAHTLRNRLAAMLGWIEIADQRLDNTELVRTSLAKAMKAGRAAAEHVKQLLKFGRKTKTSRAPIPLHTVVEEAAALLKNVIPSSLNFLVDIDHHVSPVSANADEIQQVIIDLGTNAAHAMNLDGTLAIKLEEITVSAAESVLHVDLTEGRYALITVSDTGQGIPEERLDRIFEPFFTTKEPGQGTGLGLSIVHGIVKSHDGIIDVHSTPGEGTTFRILLPVCAEPAVAESVDRPHDTTPSRPTIGLRVLLVDDDQEFLEMARTGLELFGYAVEPHFDPFAALESFRNTPAAYDIVVTDNVMPSLRGIQLARKMRDIYPDVTTILVSGVSEALDEDDVRQAGIRVNMSKPVTPSILAETIQRTYSEVQSEAVQ